MAFDVSPLLYSEQPSMKDPSKKYISKTNYPYPKDKPKPPKADPDTRTFFEKAKSLFILDKRANPANERGWEAYIANRAAAEKDFHGARKIKSETEEGDEDSWDEEEPYDCRGGELDYLYALNLIRRCMANMEKEMKLGEGILMRSFRVLDCSDLHFKQEERPRTVNTLTRIYSPTRPVYIDVRFWYHYRRRYYSTEWDYSLDCKIYSRPGVNDYVYSGGKGWESIAYGSYGNCGRSGKRWVKAEEAEVILEEDDVKNVYEALWGPLDVIQDEGERRTKMVNTVRVLMAAVGIGYIIAIDDDEKDDSGKVFKLEGLKDRWFGRGIRKACGFQLTRDPEEEKQGLAAREAERNRNDFPDEDDAEDDGMYYDEGDPSNSDSDSDSASG